MKTQLIINQELRDLLPPLSPKQFKKLEDEIIKDGCTAPLTVWGEIIVDGHHRYAICTKHGIEFQTTQKVFESMDEAKLWMWQNQNSRRNLSRFQRAETALKMKPIVANQANERRLSTLKQNTEVQNSAPRTESKKTRQILAEFAEVSHETLDRVEFLLEHADAETLNKLRWDKRDTSINKEFTRLKAEFDAQKPKKEKKTSSKKATSDSATPAKETPSGGNPKSTQSASSKTKTKVREEANDSSQSTFFETPDTTENGDPVGQTPETVTVSLKSDPKVKETYCCGVKFEPDPDDDYFDWITDEQRAELKALQANCPNRIVPSIHNFTIQNIPEHKPDQLINCLFSLFKPRYREKFVFALLRTMAETETDREIAHNIVTTLFHEFQN